jgi:uncharacterized protein YaaN involved in tellurite resistance
MDTAQTTLPQPVNQSAAPVRLDKDGNVDLSLMSEDDIKKYQEIGKSIKPGDTNSILEYGAETQKTMERYSNQFLSSVRTYNSGEVGKLITDLLGELDYINVDELDASPVKRFFGSIPFVRKMVIDAKKLFEKYDTIIGNVEKIMAKIKVGRENSLKDNVSLQTMFDSNVEYIKQMEQLIIAGQLRYKELTEQLAQMEASPDSYKDYEIADLREFATRLDKRLADMKVIRYIMMQSLAQIRVVQNNNTSIAEKAQTIISTTIPIWKNQLTIAVALQRQKANVEVQKKVSDTTNTILLKNAQLLKQNSIEVAKENERTVVSIDTLKNTTQTLIETLTEVKRIHDEGTANRKVLNSELQNLETELRKNVTSIK